MKKLIISILVILTLGIIPSKSNGQIEISLLTCSSGKETFTAWGHSALRVQDKQANIDVVYNFGLFDFNTPNFYLKFVKGRLKYKLGVHRTQDFYNSYLLENRQIIEQELNLSEENKITIINRLRFLYRPENRYYLYSFVGKNCTTELRNLILENVETNFENKLTNKTHRQQLNEFLKNRLWLRFSMSLIMGYQVDKKIDLYESMFLPDYLYNEFNNLELENKPLVKSKRIINNIDKSDNNYPFLLSPLFILLALLILMIFVKSKLLQNFVLTVVGLTGLTILVVSLFTEHPELKYNLNYLWINPLYIVLVILGTINKRKVQFYLSIVLQVLSILMIFIWIFKVQDYDIGFFPILFILSLINYRIIKTKATLFS